ncbi:MAG: GNAT family N-acetyltransferase, partial [Rubrivivax sp.]|nr:GNAT family N-acetyltransferase [Rubrivivax sp.]
MRSLTSRHRSRILTHLLGLDEHDRYMRFGFAASDAQIGHYTDSLDFERDELFGIFNRRLELIAMAHL